MIEVFKTNVCDPSQAKVLTEELCERSGHYKVNFDLEDTDRILRVQSSTDSVDANFVIRLLNEFGFTAEVLPD